MSKAVYPSGLMWWTVSILAAITIVGVAFEWIWRAARWAIGQL